MENHPRISEQSSQIDEHRVKPPPRWLMLFVLFSALLVIGSTLAGVFIFRDVLRPGQQQRVIQMLPFMERFLPLYPGQGLPLPTPLATYTTGISPFQLLTPALETVTEPTSTMTVPPPSPTSPAVVITQTPQISTQVATDEAQAAIPTMVPVTFTPAPTSVQSTFAPSNAYLSGFRYVVQTWNNCGPATITMALSYFGWQEDMEFAASILKPDDEDKNVTAIEMTAFVNEQSGVRAIWRMGGNPDLLRSLLAGGFPVVAAIGFAPEGYDWLGHYRLLVGYDDTQGVFFAYDSYLGIGDNGNGITVAYNDFDADWRQFNRKFIVLYQAEDEERLRALLTEWVEPMRAAELALERAREETQTNPYDGFGWFNMGTSLVALGRYEDAALSYDQARRFNLPWRILWYQFGPFEAYFNTQRYSDMQSLLSSNLNSGGQFIEETYYWQGRLQAVQGQLTAAQASFEQALRINPSYRAAQDALSALAGS